MKNAIIFALLILAICTSSLIAQSPETFEAVKTLSAQSGKPILLEFFRDD
ncbi:MAG: hypothetical protein J7K40_05820 [candidate division Zixibacteria bacterium]|nr:hypothetical protein [candidate division Zixibacteria bacterium]